MCYLTESYRSCITGIIAHILWKLYMGLLRGKVTCLRSHSERDKFGSKAWAPATRLTSLQGPLTPAIAPSIIFNCSCPLCSARAWLRGGWLLSSPPLLWDAAWRRKRCPRGRPRPAARMCCVALGNGRPPLTLHTSTVNWGPSQSYAHLSCVMGR